MSGTAEVEQERVGNVVVAARASGSTWLPPASCDDKAAKCTLESESTGSGQLGKPEQMLFFLGALSFARQALEGQATLNALRHQTRRRPRARALPDRVMTHVLHVRSNWTNTKRSCCLTTDHLRPVDCHATHLFFQVGVRQGGATFSEEGEAASLGSHDRFGGVHGIVAGNDLLPNFDFANFFFSQFVQLCLIFCNCDYFCWGAPGWGPRRVGAPKGGGPEGWVLVKASAFGRRRLLKKHGPY